MQLNLDNITYTYPTSGHAAISDVSLTFPVGWTGIIGDNGCGKTTLSMIAARIIAPDSGFVAPDLFSAYCTQDSTVAPECLEDFAMDWSAEAIRFRELLHIDDAWLWEYGRLSGGQQKRIQIACALWSSPDVLVMDEPTNDLDVTTKALVKDALLRFKGIGILISHDRSLLDSLVKQCAVFEDGRVSMRPGNYTEVAAQIASERRAGAKAHDAAKKEAKRLHTEAVRRQEEAARSKSRLSAKGLAKGDSDKRERIGRAKVTGKDAIAGKASSTMATRLERAEAKAAQTTQSKRYDPSLHSFGSVARSKHLIHVQASTISNGALALDVPELWVSPTDRIGIVGANGTGKTTLVRWLLERISDGVRFAYIPQEVNASQRESMQAALREMSAKEMGSVLSVVAKLNSDPERVRDGSSMSPGELRKLLLAQQLQCDPNLLVLDEPTNHLDMGSIVALEEMLKGFPGAVILVSHDEELVSEVCESIWSISREGDTATLTVR